MLAVGGYHRPIEARFHRHVGLASHIKAIARALGTPAPSQTISHPSGAIRACNQGHSPGLCCFYEPERKYLYSGDLIYKGCLDAFYPSTDPQLFYRSVKRLRDYEIRRIFPGHHDLALPVSLIEEIEAAFSLLERQGKLKQGKGVFEFGAFRIHI